MNAVERKKYDELLEKTGDKDQAFTLYLRWKCLTDLFFLGNEVLGWKNNKDKTGKRYRVDKVFHRWLAHILMNGESKLIKLHRGACKSTWVKLRIVQDVLTNPNIRIGLFSVSAHLVESQLSDIKRILSTPILRRIFPDIIPDPGKDYNGWEKCNQNCLTLYREPGKSAALQADQITAYGVGAKITGIHFDKIYLDDIVDYTTITTSDQMKKTRDYFSFLQSILEVDGEMTITGTPYHYNDLYAEIEREKIFDHIYKRPYKENGKILYASWFTEKDFEKLRKTQSNYIFSCQYELNPIPIEDQIFPPPHPTYPVLPQGEYQYYITVDPAATATSTSDETGVVIAAKDKMNNLYIEEAIGVKKTNVELAHLLIQKCLQYKPVRVGIEFGLQESLRFVIDTVKSEYENKTGVHVPLYMEGIPVSRRLSKGARVSMTLGAFIREGKLHINERCIELLREMDTFTGKGAEKDNLVDAAAMILSVIDTFAYRYWVKASYGNTYGLTFLDIFKNQDEYCWRKEFA